MLSNDKYEKIISTICETKGIERNELYKILEDKECKYMLFMFLKKYRCTDLEKIKQDLGMDTKNKVNYNVKKGEEKLFVNREFREKYFETDEMIKKII